MLLLSLFAFTFISRPRFRQSKLAGAGVSDKHMKPSCWCQGCAIAHLFSFSNQFLEASPNKPVFTHRVNEATQPAGITVKDVLIIFKLHRWHKKYMTGTGQASMFALPVSGLTGPVQAKKKG